MEPMDWMGPASSDGLAAWFELWVDGFVRFFGAAALIVLLVGLAAFAVVALWGVSTVRRRFWCPLARRDVDVEFEWRGILPHLGAVKSCSAFEVATDLSCTRRCVDPSMRRRWEPALPVHRFSRVIIGSRTEGGRAPLLRS